jgi:type IV secretion system protein VirB10
MITLAALAVGCGVFLAATWDRGDANEAAPSDRDTPPRELAPFEPAHRSDPPTLSETDIDPAAPLLTDDPIPPLAAAPGSDPGSAGPSPAETRRALAESAQRAPVLAYSSGGGAPVAPAVADQRADPSAAPITALDELRQSGPIARAQAGRLGDRNLLLAAGTSLPCVLQTAMDSTTPGYVSCVLTRDVYSDNGAVVLMERGSRVLGEYRGGLQQGRRRLFVLWTRTVTPTGVAIALASPAADDLGRAGFDGEINRHFWDRFGGALLLSLVDDGAYAALGRSEAAGASARLPSDAAGLALQGSVDIPATLRKAQGSEVSIFVAQDLDFSGVYRLRARR